MCTEYGSRPTCTSMKYSLSVRFPIMGLSLSSLLPDLAMGMKEGTPMEIAPSSRSSRDAGLWTGQVAP